jgi:RND family efflux transporter MFP subunit
MNSTRKKIVHFCVTIILLAFGMLGMRTLSASKTELKKHEMPPSVPTVRAVRIAIGPRPVHVLAQGTVRALRQIQLVPQVGGKIVYISPALVDGGAFHKEDSLLRIDPVDYQLAVTLAESKVKDAESELKLAEEEAAAAREEWCEHCGDGSEGEREPPPLVVKEPQLAAARAKLAAERAELKIALLNLERTELKAPFNGRVSEENVDMGQYVSPGQALATLFSTDSVEIVVPLENEELFWFHVPGFTPRNAPGSPVEVRAKIAGRALSWGGEVVRAEGKLDERTRMINVVVRVKDPYAKKPPLALGLFVTVDIKGRSLENASVIPRSALHQGDVVWVVNGEGRLCFRRVNVARISADDVMVESGLAEGETVVISSLNAVTDGMKVEVLMPDEVMGS